MSAMRGGLKFALSEQRIIFTALDVAAELWIRLLLGLVCWTAEYTEFNLNEMLLSAE